jgi:SAM-dependent methyltransferase
VSDEKTDALEGYRASHARKDGRAYDDFIYNTPLDAYMAEWEERYIAQILDRRFPQGVERYLDFACGTARITRFLARRAREATGVDISPTMLEVARQKAPHIRFEQADLTREDRPDLTGFDLISAFRFFGNAEHGLRQQVLATIHRRLKPGGMLLFNNHRNPNSMMNRFHRLTGGALEQDFTHAKMDRLLHEQGFEIVERRPIGFWMVLYRYATGPAIAKAPAPLLERMFGASLLAPLAPDALILARKR